MKWSLNQNSKAPMKLEIKHTNYDKNTVLENNRSIFLVQTFSLAL